MLDAVAGHLGRLRRADLAHVCRPVPPGLSLDDEAKRQARRDVLNARKQTITAESSSRWAGTIIRANDDQYRLARESQARHIVSLGAAISGIEKRLVKPTGDTLAARAARHARAKPEPRDMRPRRNASKSSAGCSTSAPSLVVSWQTGTPSSRGWSMAGSGWRRPGTTSVLRACRGRVAGAMVLRPVADRGQRLRR